MCCLFIGTFSFFTPFLFLLTGKLDVQGNSVPAWRHGGRPLVPTAALYLPCTHGAQLYIQGKLNESLIRHKSSRWVLLPFARLL
jgi:hypothetical protein